MKNLNKFKIQIFRTFFKLITLTVHQVEIDSDDGFTGENIEMRTDPNGFTYEYEYYEDDYDDYETGERGKKERWNNVEIIFINEH